MRVPGGPVLLVRWSQLRQLHSETDRELQTENFKLQRALQTQSQSDGHESVCAAHLKMMVEIKIYHTSTQRSYIFRYQNFVYSYLNSDVKLLHHLGQL